METTTVVIIWGTVAALMLTTELMTGTLYLMCLFIGALGAVVAALAGGGLTAQIVTFALISLVTIFGLRPIVMSKLERKDAPKSNADALIGRVGRVTEKIAAHGYGRMAVDGDDWKAESDSDEDIEVGARVEIIGRESIIVRVKRVE